MTPAEASAAALQRLELTLSAGALPEEVAQRGAELLMRLKSPVNLAVIGMEGSGKSRLINMLLDDTVIPDDLSAPLVEIVRGDAPSTRYTAGGETLALQEGGKAPADCVLARIERPLDALRDMSVTEVRLSGSPSNQMAAVQRALLRADIVLWVSQEFSAHEQALWSAAPETLKDHSFLVLAKADQMMMKGTLTDRLDRLEGIVAEEFYNLYPVATLQAISARRGAAGCDASKWEASGAKSLIDALRRQILTGRREDTDSALLYLNRYGVSADEARAVTPAANDAPAAAHEAASAASPSAPALLRGGTPMDQAPPAFAAALEYLQDHAARMLALAAKEGAASNDDILERCSSIANGLVDILMEEGAGENADPGLAALRDDVVEGADMMLLFQLEKNDDAATDAVTLLIQLKREVAARLNSS